MEIPQNIRINNILTRIFSGFSESTSRVLRLAMGDLFLNNDPVVWARISIEEECEKDL